VNGADACDMGLKGFGEGCTKLVAVVVV